METTGEKQFLIFNGQVVIVCSTPDAGIASLTNKIIELTTACGQHAGGENLCLLIDLSPYSAVTSTFFGTLGATIQIPNVKMVGLCGMKGHVKKTASRFGIVDGGVKLSVAAAEITDNANKFRIFDSLDEGVLSIIPKMP